MLSDTRSLRAGLQMYLPRRQVVALAEQLTVRQRRTLLLAGATEALYLYSAEDIAAYFAVSPVVERTTMNSRSDQWLVLHRIVEVVSPTQFALTSLGREVVCLLLGDYVACALSTLHSLHGR